MILTCRSAYVDKAITFVKSEFALYIFIQLW
jgi:hypothetical protein